MIIKPKEQQMREKLIAYNSTYEYASPISEQRREETKSYDAF